MKNETLQTIEKIAEEAGAKVSSTVEDIQHASKDLMKSGQKAANEIVKTGQKAGHEIQKATHDLVKSGERATHDLVKSGEKALKVGKKFVSSIPPEIAIGGALLLVAGGATALALRRPRPTLASRARDVLEATSEFLRKPAKMAPDLRLGLLAASVALGWLARRK